MSRSSQGQGHFKVKVIPESNGKCLDFYPEEGGEPPTECILVLDYFDISSLISVHITKIKVKIYVASLKRLMLFHHLLKWVRRKVWSPWTS